MKVKYVVYPILAVGLMALVAYRIINNKKQGENEKSGQKGDAVEVGGIVLKTTQI